MIEITALAEEKLAAYLSENNIDSPVRIAAMNSCSGASLGLALDECTSDDLSLESKSVTLIIEPELSKACGQVTVDYIDREAGGGFLLKSENKLPGGGGCGGSCGSGGCGC